MKPGTYIARATSATLCKTKAGREQIAVDFESKDAPGQSITWFGYFGDKLGKDGKSLTERTVDALRTCGWQSDDLADLSTIGALEVQIVVDEEEYEGKRRCKVQFINRVGGGFKVKPLPDRDAKSFAESMKVKVSRAAPPLPLNQQQQEREPGEDRDEDDLQF